MVKTAKKSTIIFDGDCGICQKFRKTVEYLDWFQQLNCRRLQESDLYREFPFLSPSACQKEIKFITKAGHIYGGGRAVVEIGCKLPLCALWIWPFLFPPLKYFVNWAYTKVADNRYKISTLLRLDCHLDKQDESS